MGEKLGQHFLKNKSAITRIIDALDLQRGETVIEIGPGKGALTMPLAEECRRIGCRLIAIEKDRVLIRKLISSQVDKSIDFKIIEGDALRELPRIISTLFSESTRSFGLRPQDDGREIAVAFKLVGNIPYYITGALLRVIGELPHQPARTVLMVQREVAERVVAQPPHMNLLAAAMQIWADASLLFTLPASDFDPPPKVESAVIRLQTTDDRRRMTDVELRNYYRFIHAAFKQPRKTLVNNLQSAQRGAHNVERTTQNEKNNILRMLEKLGYTEKTRAQELSVDRLVTLSQIL